MVGDTLVYILTGSLKRDLADILLFSAGTLISPPFLAIRWMKEKSSPKGMVFCLTILSS